MKQIISFFIFIFILSSGISFSQDETMQKWMAYMTPGDVHKMLASNAGKWKASTKFWMAPNTEATQSSGTATNEMIMGGRYLMSKFAGDMMGMPFEGMSIEGYDNTTKMFNSVWIDNMGTGIMYMTGKWDDATKTVNYTGKMADFMTGNYIDIRQTYKVNDDGTAKMEMFGPAPDGKEFKTMEIIFTKQ